MEGPSACGEFMRMDLAPRTAQPSSQRLAIATPALRRASASGEPKSANPNGALLEMCCTLVPVLTRVLASRSSHLRPDGLVGLKPAPPPPPSAAVRNMVSSATSPKRPENRSIRVTPGKLSFVHCGKSSIVISPYFCFISAVVVRSRFAGVDGALGDGGATAPPRRLSGALPGPP